MPPLKSSSSKQISVVVVFELFASSIAARSVHLPRAVRQLSVAEKRRRFLVAGAVDREHSALATAGSASAQASAISAAASSTDADSSPLLPRPARRDSNRGSPDGWQAFLKRCRESLASPAWADRGRCGPTRPGRRPRPRSGPRCRPTRAASASAGRPPRVGGRRRSAASSSAESSVAAAGATRLTRPSRSASSAPTVREESSRYLAAARPQRVTRRAGPTGTPSAAPGKRIRRLAPPTRMSQAIAISAPPPTTSPWQAAIVGFGKATIVVVEVGEELHAADLALLVELLAHVGAGGEAEVVGGADHQHPHRLVAARDRQVLEQLDQHLGVDRVARLRAARGAAARPRCSSTA